MSNTITEISGSAKKADITRYLLEESKPKIVVTIYSNNTN